MKTYLVTGGAGFIGSNFVLYLLRNYDDIRLVNVDKLTYAGNLGNLAEADGDGRHVFVRADICDTAAMDALFERYKPEFVVNFAAESHVDRSIQSPGVFAQTNVLGTVTLLNAARKTWERPEGSYREDVRFLQVSTDEVYGSLPLDDATAFFREDTPLNPRSPYAASKASADMFVKAYGDTYGMPVNITRCSNNYGPRQFPEKLIPRAIVCALRHEKIPVYGDGRNVRDWLFVDDHCRAIDAVLQKASAGEVYNIGSHNERANIDIVRHIIAELADMTGDAQIDEGLIEYVPDRKGHDRRYAIAPDKIAHDLGWKPETPFEAGIAGTIRWYLANEQWVEHVLGEEHGNANKRS